MRRDPTFQRADWVDHAKAIGIVLVVYGHVARGLRNAGIGMDGPVHDLVDSVIYSFHMPLFFFLSGLFFLRSLRQRGAGALMASKVDTIVYPYLLWSLIQGLVEAVLSDYTNGDVGFAEVLRVWDPRAQFWFLYALFLVMLAAVVVYRSDRASIVVPALAVSALTYVWQDHIPASLHSNYVVENFVFFALGVAFSAASERAGREPRPWTMVALAGFLVAQAGFHAGLGLEYTDKGLASLGLATISIAAVVGVSRWLSCTGATWFAALGRASMAIYLMHVLAGSGARVVLGQGLGVDDATLHLLLGCASGIVVPVLVLHVSQRAGWSWLLSAPRCVSLTGTRLGTRRTAPA
jgi:fucose 4-O-acetylase-like acetyltransferase